MCVILTPARAVVCQNVSWANKMHLPRRWINRSFYEYFAANIGAYFFQSTPILVYQMGKVGSSAVRNALFRSQSKETSLVLMSHEFYPVRSRDPDSLVIEPEYRSDIQYEIDHARRTFSGRTTRQKLRQLLREIFYSEMIYRNVIRRNKPAKVITLVRDPIANNISMFFEVFNQYTDSQRDLASYELDELAELFLQRYIHSRPLTWLDVELKRTLGIDVYKHELPKEKGYTVIEHGVLQLLILKCEIPDSTKEEAIARFVGIDDFKMLKSNVAADKVYAEQYKLFKETIRFPDAYLDRMYNSKFARHFYSESELSRFREKWRTRPAVR